MYNRYLRDRQLSLKAKGLFALMLSLPATWNYSLKGLASICREGTDSINTAIKELESGGYIERKQVCDGDRHFAHWEYTILEKPGQQKPEPKKPGTGKPDTGKPDTEKPDTGFPYLDNPAQLNI